MIDAKLPPESAQELAQLLARLQDTPGLDDFAALWIAVMTRRLGQLDGVSVAHLSAFAADGGTARLLAREPANRLAGEDLRAAFKDAADLGEVTLRGAMPGQPSGAALTSLALPLRLDGTVQGWIGLEAEFRDRAAITRVIAELRLASGWVLDRLRNQGVAAIGERHEVAAAALHAIIAVAERDSFLEAAHAAVSALAVRFGCDRVSLGMMAGQAVRVTALSFAAEFRDSQGEVRDLQAAMAEAIDQESPLLWPALPGSSLLTRAHEALARHQDGRVAIFTVPMVARDAIIGAFVFERPLPSGFAQADLEMLEAVVTVLAPILQDIRANDRWLIVKAVEAGRRQLRRLFGPRHVRRKIVAALSLLVLVVLAFGTATRTIKAEAIIEGARQRVISPSHDGFIAAANAREGDHVRAGDILVQLDDRDLQLEKLRLAAQQSQEQLAVDAAIASRDRSQTAIHQARMRQNAAQIDLVEAEIERTRLRAPFDGLIISGNLDTQIGSSAARGTPLLTMVPDNAFRVVLRVDETSIAHVRAGEDAALRLQALPDQPFPLRISDVTPVAVYDNGRTWFKVRADLVAGTPDLRHGMQGVARIEVDRVSLWQLWVTPLLQSLRLALWSWRLF